MKQLTKADAEFLGEIEPSRLKGPKRTSHLILASIILLIIIATIWAYYAVIDEEARGEGKVIPSRQIQKVQNLEGGIVEKILVREGENVEKSQPLIVIDETRYLAEYNENLIKLQSLDIKLLRLKAEIQNKPFVIPEDLKKAQPDIAMFETALYEARKEQLQQLRESYNLAKRELDMTRPLVQRGAASPVEILRLQRTLSELNTEIINFRSQTIDQLNETQSLLLTLRAANVAAFDRLRRTTVVAPSKGVIKQLFVHTAGGVVQPGMDLAEIVPADDTLLVEVKISPRDIGFVQLGQAATVNLTAYNYSIYGSLEGTVEHISADAITDEKDDKSYYLVNVRTTKDYLGTKEHPLLIIPGMQATIHIKTGKKTVLEYLLQPIFDVTQRALRER